MVVQQKRKEVMQYMKKKVIFVKFPEQGNKTEARNITAKVHSCCPIL